jgi:hypothetical protein
MFFYFSGYPRGREDVISFSPDTDPLERIFNASGPASGSFVQSIVTPNVKREVRDFFGCDTLTGAELEDDGASGTFLTHFETRVYQV